MAGALRFPISDHCDGQRFFNPHGRPQARSFLSLPKWWFQTAVLGQGTPWPKQASPPAVPRLPVAVPAGQVAVTFIGHATFLLQLPDLNILTDPMFSRRAGPFGWAGPPRVRPPALNLSELLRIDAVLLTHNHYDHLDLPSLRWLARERRVPIITTLGNKAWLTARGIGPAVELDWWQSHACTDRLTVTCTPAQHFAARAPWDRCRTLWGGFVLRTGEATIYFAGDTGYCDAFTEIGARLGPIALALLPIGAYEPRWFMAPVHCSPEEAVRIHRDVRARRSLAMHFGTFELTDEGIDAPPRALASALAAAGIPPDEFAVPGFGETRLVPLA
ncbi:MAG TPA: MBL fold metallo-hydrolase [Lacunisphaera sp.]|nr:MBL fold metallo-hydrolase [Lacunisphaera sp.]